MHTHRAALLAIVSVLAVTAACDIGEKVGCDFRVVDEDGLNNGAEDRCQERSGIGATGFGASCEGIGGTVVDGGCPVEGIVFGCDLGDSGTDPVIDWYYAPHTIDEAEQLCGSDTIVDAP